ncbi:MAG TPA: YtcA family lipoprotein [Bryobacteraceae bacterium]|jgi:hypothetical protein
MFSHAPLLDIFGSFFPVWMLCIGAAAVLTLLVRLGLVRVGLDQELGPRIIIYPSMAALFACAIWLMFFND